MYKKPVPDEVPETAIISVELKRYDLRCNQCGRFLCDIYMTEVDWQRTIGLSIKCADCQKPVNKFPYHPIRIGRVVPKLWYSGTTISNPCHNR